MEDDRVAISAAISHVLNIQELTRTLRERDEEVCECGMD